MINPNNDLREILGVKPGFKSLRMEAVLAWHQKEVKETEKAYGGCRNCFGKGYSTVIEYASGYDTDQDIGSPGGKVHYRKPDIRFCTCDRGKQLEKQVKTAVREARLNELYGLITPIYADPYFEPDYVLNLRGRDLIGRIEQLKQEGINPQREGRNG